MHLSCPDTYERERTVEFPTGREIVESSTVHTNGADSQSYLIPFMHGDASASSKKIVWGRVGIKMNAI